MKKQFLGLVLFAVVSFVYAAGQQDDTPTVVFGDNNYDSVQVHNRIAGFILENGYGGYEARYVPGDTIPLINGISAGDVHVLMESWHENYLDVYTEEIQSGDIVNIGDNMPKAPQGWYIPRYVVEGDSSRGIDPIAPGLQSVSDLPDYWELFQDPENPDRGRILVGPPGWAATEVGQGIMDENGLNETFTAVLPGSGTALNASLVSAYQRGEPWLGYNWEPTAIVGRLDLILLEGSEFPPTSVDVLVADEFVEDYPEVTAFLERYYTTLEQNNVTLAAMEDQGLDAQGAALFFLREYEDTWTEWVSAEVADRVRAALAAQ